MPTYDYECKSCKAVYELRQGFDAATTHKCEECGTGTAKRVLRVPSVVFKGSGWYATDSRNSKSAVSEGSSDSTSEAPAEKSEPKESTKKETKVAETSESKPASTSESAAAG